MSLTKLSLAGNNLPNSRPRKVWSKQIQESRFFLQCRGHKYEVLKAGLCQVQGNLSETAGRAQMQEQALAKLKIKGRAASVGPQ